MQAAVVLGASGSTGKALVAELIRTGSFGPIVTVVRRTQPDEVTIARDAGAELRELLVPAMAPSSVEAATMDVIPSLEGEIVGFSVLGVGAGTAKVTIDEHRAVDVQLNAAFARGLNASGRVRHLAFMSAAGANPGASTAGSGAAGTARYARVKGEAEEAVKANGPAVVSIFRPALIIGSRHTPWLLEKVLPLFSFVTPAKYRSIDVQQIAKAMIATSLRTPAKTEIYHYPEMMALNTRSQPKTPEPPLRSPLKRSFAMRLLVRSRELFQPQSLGRIYGRGAAGGYKAPNQRGSGESRPHARRSSDSSGNGRSFVRAPSVTAVRGATQGRLTR